MIRSDEFVVNYSGPQDESRKEVGLLMKRRSSQTLQSFWPVSVREVLAKFARKQFDLVVIQVYATPLLSNDKNHDAFYADLNSAVQKCKKHEVLLVMGDLIAKVGKSQTSKAIGRRGLVERNVRGEKFGTWRESNSFNITNNCFQKPKRRLYTWQSQGGQARNQIDYVCINDRFKTSVANCTTFPEAYCGIDHNPVVVNLAIKLKKLTKRKAQQHNRQKISPNQLLALKKAAEERIPKLDTWKQVKTACFDLRDQHIPVRGKQPRKAWITENHPYLRST